MQGVVAPDPADKLLVVNRLTGEVGTAAELAISALQAGSIDDVFDSDLIATYLESSHSPLVGTILRDTIPLFPRSTLSFDSSLGFDGLTELLDFDISNVGIEDAVQGLANHYQDLQLARRVNLFFSAGWDSRVELALVLQWVAPERISLFHFFENADATIVVRRIAELYGLRLVELDPLESVTRASGISLDLLDALALEPVWRPSIPAFHEILRANMSHEEEWLGFVSWGLKGRYNEATAPPLKAAEIGGNLWRLRAIEPVPYLSSTTGRLRSMRHQNNTWHRLRNLTRDWPGDVALDYANWSLSDGFAYSHRVRVLQQFGLRVVSGRFDFAKTFWSLPRAMKSNNTFQKRLLDILSPHLSQIPVLSSSDGAKRDNTTRPLQSQIREFLQIDTQARKDKVRHRGIVANSRTFRLLQLAKKSSNTTSALSGYQIENFILSALGTTQG